ncbi:hypothetical protein E2C01_032355 [Portunus trituberculatus]|uniref:Uncharacterized protein n=1 Tax=Portunus trituberculatus TaxID=210409 RepID=A0A5B7F0Q4_PORTR|nr:hypothetical protein [Portunus trituberculatus]
MTNGGTQGREVWEGGGSMPSGWTHMKAPSNANSRTVPTSYSDGTHEVNTLLSSKIDEGKSENDLRKRNSQQQQLYENGRKSQQILPVYFPLQSKGGRVDDKQ